MFGLNTVLFICCTINLLTGSRCEEFDRVKEDIWEQDLTDTFKIDGSSQGIQKVNLKCGAEYMHVSLETEQEFSGVMYTRGSFYKQSEPCFIKPTKGSVRSLEMKFNFNQCETQKDGELYTNVVVIQNDPELITPGDSAFSLECDFRQPRNLNVQANLEARERIVSGSRITFTSPDPSYTPNDSDDKDTVHNTTDFVTYEPKHLARDTGNGNGSGNVQGSVEEVPIWEGIKGSVVKDEL